jgi:asparaginyl-tRNA synthetase
VKWGCDLQSEHERYITEEAFGGCPVIIRDYPKALDPPFSSTLLLFSGMKKEKLMLTFISIVESYIVKLFNVKFQEIKAFYMRQNDDGRTVAAMDMLVPRVILKFLNSFLLLLLIS